MPQVWQTFTHNVVASNKGVSIADIDIGTTVYIKLKNQDAYEGRWANIIVGSPGNDVRIRINMGPQELP